MVGKISSPKENLQIMLSIMSRFTALRTGETPLDASEVLPHPDKKALDPAKLPALTGARGMT